MATNCTPDEFADAVATVRGEAQRRGRNPDDIDIVLSVR